LAFVESLNPDINLVIDPLSVYKMLTAISEGAGGKTFEELRNALGLGKKEKSRDFFVYLTTLQK
jgi:serine protease inhibitor